MLAEIRERLIARLETEVPELRDVGAHFGRMTPEEVKRVSAFPPACRCGLFGRVTSDFLASGEQVILSQFAAVIITRERDLLAAHDAAMELAVRCQAAIGAWRPGLGDAEADPALPNLPGVGLPKDIAIDVSADVSLDKEGVALWAVLFKLPVIIGENLAETEAAGLYEITGYDDLADIELEEAP